MKYLLLCFFLSFFLSFSSNAQDTDEPNDSNGEVRYISDDLFIYMHAGPGRDFRILGSVSAGTQVSLLQVDREAGYVEIIDDRQRTGWVQIKFVSRTPSIRSELASLQQSIELREQEIQDRSNEIEAISTNLAESKQQKILLNRQVSKQLEEIAELKRRISQRDKTDQLEWFTRGTVLALISVIVGYLLGLFGRKKKAASRLM